MRKHILVENRHGTGAIKNKLDLRDRKKWSKLAAKISQPFDWNKGYDVEEELQIKLNDPFFKMPVKDQGTSSSCVGQAISYYESVQDAFEKGVYTEKSARDGYSQIFYPDGGSSTRDGLNLLTKRGVCKESLLTSYKNGAVPDEPFMRNRNDCSQTTANDALGARGTAYAPVGITIDEFAQAIRDRHGMVATINGENNGTWRSSYPKPPKNYIWAHELYFGKAFMKDGKKYVAVLNSWSKEVGSLGWQFIGEEYFNKKYLHSSGVLYDSTNDALIAQKTLLEKLLELLQKLLFGTDTKVIHS